MEGYEMKYSFGKWYRKESKKPMTPFQKFYNVGFEQGFSEREIAIGSWNAALTVASDRLKMYGESSAIELLEILYED